VMLLLVVAAGLCAGEASARVQPIYTVQGHPVPSASASLGPDQITQLIASTAQSTGWVVEPLSSTQLRATQKWRTHSATVIITTDGRTYSIHYETSTNLLQQGGSIHREYNKRVHALEDAIEKRLYRP
jgi:hypothetical protein